MPDLTPERDRIEVHHGVLPVGEFVEWATRPECGAVVTFTGTARDHAPGRPGVTELEYEGYEEYLVERMSAVVTVARTRWPELVAAGVAHRLGMVGVGEAAVVVVASSAHRTAAFEAGRFLIDTVKATVPIWKRETWADGTDWGLDGCFVGEIADVPRPPTVPVGAVANRHSHHHLELPDLSTASSTEVSRGT